MVVPEFPLNLIIVTFKETSGKYIILIHLGKFVRDSKLNTKPSEETNQMMGVESNDPPFTGEVDSNTAQYLKDGTGN